MSSMQDKKRKVKKAKQRKVAKQYRQNVTRQDSRGEQWQAMLSALSRVGGA
jgi:hypothetical protein